MTARPDDTARLGEDARSKMRALEGDHRKVLTDAQRALEKHLGHHDDPHPREVKPLNREELRRALAWGMGGLGMLCAAGYGAGLLAGWW